MSYFAHLFPLYAYFNMEKDALKYIFNKLYVYLADFDYLIILIFLLDKEKCISLKI